MSIYDWLDRHMDTTRAAVLGPALLLSMFAAPVAAGSVWGLDTPLPVWVNMLMPLWIMSAFFCGFVLTYGLMRGAWNTPETRRERKRQHKEQQS